MKTLNVNPMATKTELVNDAIAFTKYATDAEAMAYLNVVLDELRWKMSANEFHAFNCRINTMVISA